MKVGGRHSPDGSLVLGPQARLENSYDYLPVTNRMSNRMGVNIGDDVDEGDRPGCSTGGAPKSVLLR